MANDLPVRQYYRTGNPYEALGGYSRAVRIGNVIAVSGTTATEPDGRVTGGSDPAAQARRIFEIAPAALRELGGSLDDVIRVRIFVRDIAHLRAVGGVLRETLGHVAPAATGVEISRFIADEILVEIEVDAVLRTRE